MMEILIFFCTFSAVVETSPMMPADYREEVNHFLEETEWGGGVIPENQCDNIHSCSVDYSIEEKV